MGCTCIGECRCRPANAAYQSAFGKPGTSLNVEPNVVRLNFVAKILAEMGPHFYRGLGQAEWVGQVNTTSIGFKIWLFALGILQTNLHER